MTRDVPPYAIVAGTPATVKRLRFPEKTVERLLAVRWWEFDLPEISGLPFNDIDRCLNALEIIRATKAPNVTKFPKPHPEGVPGNGYERDVLNRLKD